ncbi:MAG: hypothetical protein D6706_00930 [Chloroflexi bacterium]|nr:MAG: hypothetical protein D6706_00930 [Chloroflexota bacterium]
MKLVRTVRHSHSRKWLALVIHLFTASGAVWGLLAILAIFQHAWQAAFLWMMLATLVDSVDGTLARWLRITEGASGFDGALLDNIVDYETYVIVPALLVYEAGLLPASWALAGTAVIVLTSAFQFSQLDAKTEDHFFKGFPSYWNVLALYLFLLQLPVWFNLVLVIICGILVFVPVKYLYPSRMERFRRLTLVLTLTWGGLMLTAVLQYPHYSQRLVWLSLLYAVYYFAFSLWLSRSSSLTQP